MNSSSTLYRTPSPRQQETVSPHEPRPEYRNWRFDNRVTEDLLEEIAYLRESIELLRGFRLEYLGSEPNRQYIELRLTDLLKTVEHRKRLLQRYQDDPLAPSWPQGAGKIGRLAADLKQLWPLPKFCREMLLIDLQRQGDRLRARCPIPTHDDKSPSFTVFVADDRWHCFGACGSGGDIYDLIRAIYGHESFRAQVRMLASATGDIMGAPR